MKKKLIYNAQNNIDLKNDLDEHPPTFEKVFKYEFENVIISPYGVVYYRFKHQDQLLYERHRNKNKLKNKLSAYFLKKKVKINQSVLIIANGWADSFYHFTMESLLKLFMMRDEINSSVVVFPKSFLKKFHQEWFELLDVKNLILIDDTEVIKAKNAISTSFPARDLNHHHEVLPEFRDWVLTKMEDKRLIDHTSKYPEKIFINRSKASFRRIINFEEIKPTLLSKGYVIIDLEDYNLVEQINYFYHAKKIIGIHGAGFTHIAFTKADVKDLIFISFHQNCFLKMAKTLNIDYNFIRCKGEENQACPKFSDLRHIDLIVNINELKRIL
jgi:capsular polysaccharide biosynthesis protein